MPAVMGAGVVGGSDQFRVPEVEIHSELVDFGAGAVTVVGALEAASLQSFLDELPRMVRQGCRQVIADLSQVTVVDASALAFLELTTALRLRRSELVVVARDPAVAQAFGELRFMVFETVDEAAEHFSLTVRRT
jgi:anti-anti-sigma regulatory factor